ncbi:uncharacterized protein V6R79_007147 [Siganus canaliculatus]
MAVWSRRIPLWNSGRTVGPEAVFVSRYTERHTNILTTASKTKTSSLERDGENVDDGQSGSRVGQSVCGEAKYPRGHSCSWRHGLKEAREEDGVYSLQMGSPAFAGDVIPVKECLRQQVGEDLENWGIREEKEGHLRPECISDPHNRGMLPTSDSLLHPPHLTSGSKIVLGFPHRVHNVGAATSTERGDPLAGADITCRG